MSPETEIRVDLVCTEFLSQFKRLKANAAAVPMTKAETIMRREEALEMRWPLFLVDAIEAKLMGTWAPQEGHRLYGGSPSGSMVDTFCSGLHPIKWSDGWPA